MRQNTVGPIGPGRPVSEPRTALQFLRALASPARFRVKPDPEGWPTIPGRLGRIEAQCDGQDCHGCPEPGPLLAAWTDRPRLFARLRALPDVRPWQAGAGELRALFPPRALPAVARLIRARRRRPATSAAHLQTPPRPAYRTTSRPPDRTARPRPTPTLRAARTSLEAAASEAVGR
jgi:hypothetical protein